MRERNDAMTLLSYSKATQVKVEVDELQSDMKRYCKVKLAIRCLGSSSGKRDGNVDKVSINLAREQQ